MALRSLFLCGLLAIRSGFAQSADSGAIIMGGTAQPRERANATGSFDLRGPDARSALESAFRLNFPYRLSIAVHAAVPDPRAEGEDMATSVSDFNLAAADPAVNLTTDTDSHWRLCANAWQPSLEFLSHAEALNDTGDCAVALPRECRANMHLSVVPGSASCEMSDLPDECEGYFGGGLALTWDLKQGSHLFSHRTSAFSRTNETAMLESYGLAQRSVWVVLITWDPNNRTLPDGKGEMWGYTAEPVCMRAKNITRGSVDVNPGSGVDDSLNGVGLPGPFAGWIFLVVGLMAFL